MGNNINFKKYFDKIYFINLDKRKDRLESFNEEMIKNNIVGYERYVGVDGSSLNEENNKLLKGEIGVLLTHYNIIKECKLNNIKNVLIMEDDVYFTDEITKLDFYMNNIPKDWDFIYFGGNHSYGTKPIKINETTLKLNYTVALQCVAINNTMYDYILAMLPNKKKQVDCYYADLHRRFNSYCFTPNMAKQKEGLSDIQNKIVNYESFFKD